jgi:hypothetical protein
MSDTDKAQTPAEPAGADTKDIEARKEPKAAPKNEGQSSPPPAPKRKTTVPPRAWPAMFLLMILAAVLGAGIANYWTSPAESNRLAQAETRIAELQAAADGQENLRGDLNALTEDLGQVEMRVENLENAPAVPGVPAASGAADPRIGQLGARLNALENRVPAGLEARLSDLEQTNDNSDMLVRAGRILALGDLSRAASGSAPFANELAAAIATAPDETLFDGFRSHADEGVPVAAQLIARFPEAARQALASERADAAENIFARVWNKIAGLISIRRIGDIEGNDSGARLARAEAALGREDLAAAANEVRGLQGGAAQSMSAWLQDAEARLEIENAIAGINARIVQTLADQSAPANAP